MLCQSILRPGAPAVNRRRERRRRRCLAPAPDNAGRRVITYHTVDTTTFIGGIYEASSDGTASRYYDRSGAMSRCAKSHRKRVNADVAAIDTEIALSASQGRAQLKATATQSSSG
jgi:hypothetical protein